MSRDFARIFLLQNFWSLSGFWLSFSFFAGFGNQILVMSKLVHNALENREKVVLGLFVFCSLLYSISLFFVKSREVITVKLIVSLWFCLQSKDLDCIGALFFCNLFKVSICLSMRSQF